MTQWDRNQRLPRDDLESPSDSGALADSRSLPDSGALADSRRGEYVLNDDPAPSEVFQTLASEVRIRVLVRVLEAEEAGTLPCSFTDLQQAAGSDSSAGFAYHLRQLSGHFLRQDEDGYSLTPPGRRAARAIVDGTFTSDGGGQTAS